MKGVGLKVTLTMVTNPCLANPLPKVPRFSPPIVPAPPQRRETRVPSLHFSFPATKGRLRPAIEKTLHLKPFLKQ